MGVDMPKTKEVTFSIPGWVSVKVIPSVAESQAAWKLYVELSTRVTSQPFDRNANSVRAAIDSLYVVFQVTREILKEAGPEVAQDEVSFGPLAIRFLMDVLSPFLLQWHEDLLEYELNRPESVPVRVYEQEWDRYEDICLDLAGIKKTTSDYIAALAQIAGVHVFK
jgi:hypothetical protein